MTMSFDLLILYRDDLLNCIQNKKLNQNKTKANEKKKKKKSTLTHTYTHKMRIITTKKKHRS
jgi:hypothetical protein